LIFISPVSSTRFSIELENSAVIMPVSSTPESSTFTPSCRAVYSVPSVPVTNTLLSICSRFSATWPMPEARSATRPRLKTSASGKNFGVAPRMA
jgi:hypothetical protein